MTAINDLIATSVEFSPEAAAHTYGYDGNGNLATDTATYGGNTYVKTFIYTNGVLTGETVWVKQ